jgi:hypothetical protein
MIFSLVDSFSNQDVSERAGVGARLTERWPRRVRDVVSMVAQCVIGGFAKIKEEATLAAKSRAYASAWIADETADEVGVVAARACLLPRCAHHVTQHTG